MSGTVFGAFYDVVRRIPAGSVSTYGQVARLAGMPRSARLVGYAMASCQDPTVPCHRVVDHSGRIAPGWPEQARLLAQEGVPFRDPTHVDMKRAQWEE